MISWTTKLEGLRVEEARVSSMPGAKMIWIFYPKQRRGESTSAPGRTGGITGVGNKQRTCKEWGEKEPIGQSSEIVDVGKCQSERDAPNVELN